MNGWRMVADGARLLTDTGREVAVATRADPTFRYSTGLTAAEIARRWNAVDAMWDMDGCDCDSSIASEPWAAPHHASDCPVYERWKPYETRIAT